MISNNVKAKLEKITNDHKLMLDMVKECINNGNERVSSSINELVAILDYDEKNIKEYKAVINAQALISELTTEIIKATTPEEIADIRKKLNYYINKVKAEMKKRNINPNEIEVYMNNANYLRKSIAKYIRFLKRENNINIMTDLKNNIDDLSDEEKVSLNKLLNNELRYNKRNLSTDENTITKAKKRAVPKKENDPVKVITPKKEQEEIKVVTTKEEKKDNAKASRADLDINNIFVSSIINSNKDDDKEERFNRFVESFNHSVAEDNKKTTDNSRDELFDSFVNSILANAQAVELDNNHTTVPPIDEDYNSVEYIQSRIEKFANSYHLTEPYVYGNSFFKNFVLFVGNVPIYLRNKKAIKIMKRDYFTYHRANELLSYIEYTKKRNSILRGFGQIFSKSKLRSRENECLNNHDKCMEWIIDFYKRNSLNVNAKKKTI